MTQAYSGGNRQDNGSNGNMSNGVYKAINAVQAALAKTGISKDRTNTQGSGYKFRGIASHPEYHVSDRGDVFSFVTGKFLKPRVVNGYHHVTLGGKGGLQIAIHVLVAEAFIGPREPGLVVNHKNNNRQDNRLENLEWVTQSQNVLHAYKTGRRVINQAHRDRCALLGKARKKVAAP